MLIYFKPSNFAILLLAMLEMWLNGWKCWLVGWLVGRSVSSPLQLRLKYLDNCWMVAMKYGADIHDPERMNPSDIYEP